MADIKEVAENIYQIDNGVYGVKGWGAVYLINEEGKALIDSGPTSSAPVVLEGMAQVGVKPEEAVFVGDRLREDVAGPQGVGLRAVLVEVPFREERDESVSPDARIASITELPAVLAAWL